MITFLYTDAISDFVPVTRWTTVARCWSFLPLPARLRYVYGSFDSFGYASVPGVCGSFILFIFHTRYVRHDADHSYTHLPLHCGYTHHTPALTLHTPHARYHHRYTTASPRLHCLLLHTAHHTARMPGLPLPLWLHGYHRTCYAPHHTARSYTLPPHHAGFRFISHLAPLYTSTVPSATTATHIARFSTVALPAFAVHRTCYLFGLGLVCLHTPPFILDHYGCLHTARYACTRLPALLPRIHTTCLPLYTVAVLPYRACTARLAPLPHLVLVTGYRTVPTTTVPTHIPSTARSVHTLHLLCVAFTFGYGYLLHTIPGFSCLHFTHTRRSIPAFAHMRSVGFPARCSTRMVQQHHGYYVLPISTTRPSHRCGVTLPISRCSDFVTTISALTLFYATVIHVLPHVDTLFARCSLPPPRGTHSDPILSLPAGCSPFYVAFVDATYVVRYRSVPSFVVTIR